MGIAFQNLKFKLLSGFREIERKRFNDREFTYNI